MLQKPARGFPLYAGKDADMSTEKRMIHYALVLDEGHWKVRRDGKYYGPYPSYEAALESATAAAHTSGKNDRAAQVLTPQADGSLVPIWTSGLDDYPSRDMATGADGPGLPTADPDRPSAGNWTRGAVTVLVWTRGMAPF
jgi:hypothetical protein